jgi:hypothetical protein
MINNIFMIKQILWSVKINMNMATSTQLSSILSPFLWSLSTAIVVESLHYDRPGKHFSNLFVHPIIY